MPDGTGLRALVLDDEAHAREEIAFVLGGDPRVASVRTAASATSALKLLSSEAYDVLFCDIRMPGMDGLELARLVARFPTPLAIVFVTAHDAHAVDAFGLQAVDYVVKPVRASRLRKAVLRVCAVLPGFSEGDSGGDETDEPIPVESGDVTRFVRRSQIRYVEAHGDYARLHMDDGESHLIRAALNVLESRWTEFVRVHRGALVRLDHVDEMVRSVDGHTVLRVGSDELVVSRRHYHDVRERLSGL